MATTRIEVWIDEAIKQASGKATDLEGMKSLTEYISRLIERDANA